MYTVRRHKSFGFIVLHWKLDHHKWTEGIRMHGHAEAMVNVAVSVVRERGTFKLTSHIHCSASWVHLRAMDPVSRHSGDLGDAYLQCFNSSRVLLVSDFCALSINFGAPICWYLLILLLVIVLQ
jgi:hypothetical protein